MAEHCQKKSHNVFKVLSGRGQAGRDEKCNCQMASNLDASLFAVFPISAKRSTVQTDSAQLADKQLKVTPPSQRTG